MNGTTSIQIMNSNTHNREYHEPTGYRDRPGTIDEWQPLFVVLVILGLVGLSAAGCGVAGIGAQHKWWSAGLLNKLNQTQSLICIFVCGISGTGFLMLGIVGITKIHKTQKHIFPSSSDDFTTNDNIINHSFHNPTPQNQHSSAVIVASDYSEQLQPSPSNSKTSSTDCAGQICITTQAGGGYIGHPSKRQLSLPYLADMTLEDDSPLPLDAEDFFVELFLFNMSRQLENTGIPSQIYLPSVLFKDKKDGDVIRLKYKDQLITLTIEQQNHGLKFAKGTFEEVFAFQATYIKELCNVNSPLFGIFDPYSFYRLGDTGVVYKLAIHKSEEDETLLYLKDGTSKDFRPKVSPVKAPGDILLSIDKTKLIFVMDFCRFQPQDFDVVLNETHLIIYGRFENRPLSYPSSDLAQVDIKSDSREAMFACRWDTLECLKGRSMEEMKAIMKKSILLLSYGTLQLDIPLL